MAQEPDSALVEAAAKGDGDSFTELCRRYYPAMVAIAHSMLDDRHLAEDVAQQAFASAAVKLPQLRQKAQFASWLAAICRNEARDILRNRKLVSSIEGWQATDESKENVVCESVRAALNKLSTSEREVVFLRFYDGMSYEQISAVLSISEQAINGRLRRAKKKLAEYLLRDGFTRRDYERAER